MNKWMKVAICVGVAVVMILLVENGQSPLALAAALGIVALAVLWIAFPLIVLSKFNELLKIEREILEILNRR